MKGLKACKECKYQELWRNGKITYEQMAYIISFSKDIDLNKIKYLTKGEAWDLIQEYEKDKLIKKTERERKQKEQQEKNENEEKHKYTKYLDELFISLPYGKLEGYKYNEINRVISKKHNIDNYRINFTDLKKIIKSDIDKRLYYASWKMRDYILKIVNIEIRLNELFIYKKDDEQ